MHLSCLDTKEYARYENPPRTGRGSLFSRQESQTREPLLAGNISRYNRGQKRLRIFETLCDFGPPPPPPPLPLTNVGCIGVMLNSGI